MAAAVMSSVVCHIAAWHTNITSIEVLYVNETKLSMTLTYDIRS